MTLPINERKWNPPPACSGLWKWRSGALTIAAAKRNPKATMVGCDIWSGAYKAVFTKKRCEDNAKAEGYEDVRLIDTTDGTFMGKKEASWLGLTGSTLLTGKK